MIDQRNNTTKDLDEEEAEALSPMDKHFKFLSEVMSRVEGLGYTLEVGIDKRASDEENQEAEGQEEQEEQEEAEDQEEQQPDEKSKYKNFTNEKISRLRHIIITKRRENLLNKMKNVILFNQGKDSDILMFNTSFGNYIKFIIPREIKKAMRKDLPEKFDYLFAFTKTISEYDYWMNDHEETRELRKGLNLLGASWKRLLLNSNESLQIDAEFTRPGVEALLQNFETQLKDATCWFDNGYLKFKWN